MGYLSKRRGVISVFLLIVFMVTYVFMGMLVDAARYRMSQTYVESALDNASNSILSNYNQLVFELYGLFSVDMELEDGQTLEQEIEKKYEHYLNETLGLLDTDLSEYRTMLSELLSGQTGDENALTVADLYDFNITDLNAGTSITLADTANVENQIIEYMKFRAPVELLDESKGFLEKLKTIVTMADRVQEALNKEKIKNKYETKKNGNEPLSEQAAKLLQDINAFSGTLYNYTLAPHFTYNDLKTQVVPSKDNIYNSSPYRVKNFATIFDSKLVAAEKAYNKSLADEEVRHAKRQLEILRTIQKAITDEREEGNWEIQLILNKKYIEKTENETAGTDSYMLSEIDLEIYDTAKALDRACIDEIATNVCDELKNTWSEYDWATTYIEDYTEENTTHDNAPATFKATYDKALDDAQTLLEDFLSSMEETAGLLYEDADDLVDRIYTTVERYEAFVKELETARSKDKGTNQETVYAPEIELAEANMGELLKNLDLLANSRKYLLDLESGISMEQGGKAKLSDYMVNIAESIINEWKETPGENVSEKPLYSQIEKIDDDYTNAQGSKMLYDTEKYVSAKIAYLEDSKEIVKEILPEVQGDMCILYSHVSYFRTGHYRQDVDVIVGEPAQETGDQGKVWEQEVNSNDDKDKTTATKDASVSPTPTPSIALDSDKIKENPELLKINYSTTQNVNSASEINSEMSISGKVDSDSSLNFLQTGWNFISNIGKLLLEDARDNLYVDAYVMSMFPNYRDHYKNYKESKANGDSILSEEKEGYLASYAQVEFIITGGGSVAEGEQISSDLFVTETVNGETVYKNAMGELSVNAMRGKLFGTRVLFNMLAMMTDTAKIQQATVLSSWAGMFAPLVSTLLLVCWVVAETVLDVMILMGDGGKLDTKNGEIPLFKQSQDWLFSLEGAAEKLATMAVNAIADELIDKANELMASVEQKANVMIYKAYDAVNSGISDVSEAVDGAMQYGVSEMEQWEEELSSNISEKIGDIPTEDSEAYESAKKWAQSAVEKSAISETLESTLESGKEEVINAVQGVAEEAKEEAVLAVSKVSDKMMDTATKYINSAGTKAKEFIKKNISKVVPTGTVVKGQTAKVTMNYKDYLYFYLFLMDQETQVKRIQAVIQANINMKNESSTLLLEQSPVSVWADFEYSMKYFFMSDGILPDWMKQDGRLRAKVISAQSY